MEILYGLALIAAGMMIGAIVIMRYVAIVARDDVGIDLTVNGESGVYHLVTKSEFKVMKEVCEVSLALYHTDISENQRENSGKVLGGLLSTYLHSKDAARHE